MKNMRKAEILPVIKCWLVQYMRKKRELGIEWLEFPVNPDCIYFSKEYYQKIEPEINFLIKKIFPKKNYKMKYNYHFIYLLHIMALRGELKKKKVFQLENEEKAKAIIFDKSRIFYYLNEDNVSNEAEIEKKVIEVFKSFFSYGYAEKNLKNSITNVFRENNQFKIEIDKIVKLKNQADKDLIKIIADLLEENDRLRDKIKHLTTV